MAAGSVRCCVVGQRGSGVTSFLKQWDPRFDDAVIGMGWAQRKMEVNQEEIRVYLSPFQSVRLIGTGSSHPGLKIVFILYDITNSKQFTHLNSLINMIKYECRDVEFVLIGNKADLSTEREISPAEGKAYADQHKMHFFEVSALTGENIEHAIMTPVSNYWKWRPKRIPLEPLPPPSSSWCY